MIGAIDDYRVRIGLTVGDTTKDAEINMTVDMVLALMETYCDRKFELATTEQHFTHVRRTSLSLERYPVESIVSIAHDDNTSSGTINYHLEKATGLLMIDGAVVSHALTVHYRGGYDPTNWPADLMLAFYTIFDNVWNTVTSTGGGTAVAGAVKSVKAGDIAITYDVGASAVAASSSGGSIPPLAIGILDKYIRLQT